MNESISYYAGFAVGILVVLAVCIALKRKMLHSGKTPADYDERQQAQRGIAFRHAYLTLLVLLLANSILTGVLDRPWAQPGVEAFVLAMVSLVVFVVECIRRDAYFTVSQTPRSSIIIFTIVTLCQVPATIMHAVDGDFIADGRVTLAVLNPACMVVFAIVLIAVLIKLRREKREDEE